MQQIQYLDINRLKLHPNNPRLIKDDQFKVLCESIKKNKDYFETRPILVNKDFVIFAGNMRYRAAKEIGMKEVPVAVMDIPEERQNELMLRDNRQNGEWDVDLLAAYNDDLLKEVGFDDDELSNMFDLENLDDDYSKKIGKVLYEPKETNHKISDLFQPEHKFDEDINNLQNEEIKEMLRARVSYFGKFNFSNISEYYAYQATPEEQKILEKLALILLDKNQLIENGFADIIEFINDEN